MSTYLAYRFGKMTQCVAMKTENYESVFEANLVKFKLLGASDFEFVNSKTGATTAHKVGKTKTVNQGLGGLNLTTTSYFKLDGTNVFDILEKKGYKFKTALKLDIIHPEISLVDIKLNSPVATYKLNVKGPRQEGVPGIGNTQRNIQITTELEDLETVFLGAFILSRVDFSANTL